MAEQSFIQKNKGLIAVVAIVGVVLGASAIQTNNTTDDEGNPLYSAELDYTVKNPVFQTPNVVDHEVTNYQKQGSFSIRQAEKAGIFPADIRSQITVTCNGESVFQTEHQFSIGETAEKDFTRNLKDLPGGQRCNYNIDLYNMDNGEQVDSVTGSITVPE